MEEKENYDIKGRQVLQQLIEQTSPVVNLISMHENQLA
jgi:hypothetical protein